MIDAEISIPIRIKVTDLGEGQKDVEAFLPDGTPIYVESFGSEGASVFAVVNEIAWEEDR